MPQPQRSHHDYRRTLEPWARFAQTQLFPSPRDPQTAVYGVGDSGHWSMQAHATALAALATLGADPDTDPAAAGVSREELTATAVRMLRFFYRAHRSGGAGALDGKPWGHSWISALAVERVGHGVWQLDRMGALDSADRAGWRTLLQSEADWLLDHYPVEAAVDARSGRNKPESNLWNGCLLLRAAAEHPQDARAEAWRDKARRFLLNSISLPSDADRNGAGGTRIGGRPLADWHIGGNFTEQFGLHHHGYLNTGYMVICLSNLAMLHLYLRLNRLPLPPELYHHAQGLWQLVRLLISPEGRLLRIGGDSRARYCYCQEYLIPVWQLARDCFQDDCADCEAGWLATIRTEAAGNADGSFLGQRLSAMRSASRLYYDRLEGDRAAALSLGALWRRELPPETSGPQLPAETAPALRAGETWRDDFHGATMLRGERRFASWTWEAAEKPQGLFLPGARGDLGEWRRNLAGEILGDGAYTEYRVKRGQVRDFAGGFLFSGECDAVTCQQLYEGGDAERTIARCRLAGAALPDDGTWIGLQSATAANCSPLTGWKGMNLLLPNDVYNASRSYHSARGAFRTTALHPANHACGDWLCADGALWAGRLYGGELRVDNPGVRQIGLMPTANRGHFARLGATLGADELTIGRSDTPVIPAREAALFDLGYVLKCGDLREEGLAGCARIATGCDANNFRAVRVRGQNGKDYLFLANFGIQDAIATLTLPDITALRLLGTTAGASATAIPTQTAVSLPLPAGEAALYELSAD